MLEDSRAVLGVASISGHVFVVRAESPEVEVYSAVTWSLKRRLPVAGLRSPTDLAASESSGHLFVSDWLGCRIHRVDAKTAERGGVRQAINGDVNSSETPTTETSNGSQLKDEETGWYTTERPWSLSLADKQPQCTVLVTCDQVTLLCILYIIIHNYYLKKLCVHFYASVHIAVLLSVVVFLFFRHGTVCVEINIS